MNQETSQVASAAVKQTKSSDSVPNATADGVVDARPMRTPIRGAMTQRRRGADYYDTILWRVRPQESHGETGFTLGVTSCNRRAGVSTVAANLAIRAADHQLTPTLLVDANLIHPRQERAFRLYDAPGLADILAGECEVEEGIHPSGVAGLSVMPLGSVGLIDRASVDYERLGALLTELRSDYATTVFDLPEVRHLRHSLLIAQQVDAALLVLRSEKSRRKVAQAAVARLTADNVTVVGTVVTQQKNYVPRWFRRWI